jgi:hypothetical protein
MTKPARHLEIGAPASDQGIQGEKPSLDQLYARWKLFAGGFPFPFSQAPCTVSRFVFLQIKRTVRQQPYLTFTSRGG